MIRPNDMRAAKRNAADQRNTATLLTLLPTSKENAMHLKELSSALNLTDRATKELVLNARLGDCSNIILSNQEGYWISDDLKEIADWCESHSYSAKKSLAVCQSIRAKADKLQGQLSLEDIQNNNINE